MLNFERFAPPLHADVQIAPSDQRRQVVGLDLEDLLQRLKRIFIPFGILQILGKFQQDFDVPIIYSVRMLMEPDGFGKIALGTVDIAQPQE
ncbi:MAG: hypothetical protein HC938_04985, partial [Nitrospira sp.]|nr:hypothetical protein [Nitrospira sp.]